MHPKYFSFKCTFPKVFLSNKLVESCQLHRQKLTLVTSAYLNKIRAVADVVSLRPQIIKSGKLQQLRPISALQPEGMSLKIKLTLEAIRTKPEHSIIGSPRAEEWKVGDVCR